MLENFNKVIFSKKLDYLISFIWGFAEGTFFFAIPDIFLTYVVIFSFKRSMKNLLFVLLGSLSGAVVMYYLVSPNIDIYKYLLSVPLINQARIDLATKHLASGSIGVIWGPINGVPHKIYSLLASQLNLPIISFLFYSAISRSLRFILMIFFSNISFRLTSRFLTKSHKIHLIIFFIFWIILYIIYFQLVK